MSDWSEAAITAAQLIDELEETYGDSVVVERVMLVVEINGDVGTEDEWTGIHFRSNEQKRWIQAGFLQAALESVHESKEPRFWDDDDEEVEEE